MSRDIQWPVLPQSIEQALATARFPPDHYAMAAASADRELLSANLVTVSSGKVEMIAPLDGEIFKKNVSSTIYRIRNHPGLLVWAGGNEGHARKELYYAMRDSVIKLDGTRPFIPSSSGFAKLPEGWGGAWPDGKPSGVYSSWCSSLRCGLPRDCRPARPG